MNTSISLALRLYRTFLAGVTVMAEPIADTQQCPYCKSAHTRYAGTLGSHKVWRCRECTRTFWPMTQLIGAALPGIGRKSESNAPPELRILVRRRGSFAQALVPQVSKAWSLILEAFPFLRLFRRLFFCRRRTAKQRPWPAPTSAETTPNALSD
jgi:ribosomal protein L37AE/L43A